MIAMALVEVGDFARGDGFAELGGRGGFAAVPKGEDFLGLGRKRKRDRSRMRFLKKDELGFGL